LASRKDRVGARRDPGQGSIESECGVEKECVHVGVVREREAVGRLL
jgi:hypothetical protein